MSRPLHDDGFERMRRARALSWRRANLWRSCILAVAMRRLQGKMATYIAFVSVSWTAVGAHHLARSLHKTASILLTGPVPHRERTAASDLVEIVMGDERPGGDRQNRPASKEEVSL